eukprot:Opistho-2@3894
MSRLTAIALAVLCALISSTQGQLVGPQAPANIPMYTYSATLSNYGFSSSLATATVLLRYVPSLGIAQLNIETSGFPSGTNVLGIHAHFPAVTTGTTNILLVFCNTAPFPLTTATNTGCSQTSANTAATYYGAPLAPATWASIQMSQSNLVWPPPSFYVNVHTNIEFNATASSPNLQGIIRGPLQLYSQENYKGSAHTATAGIVTLVFAIVASLAML